MRGRARCWAWCWAIGIMLNYCASRPPTDPAHAASQPGDVVGCLAFYMPSRNAYTYERFIKVADKETLSEDGRPEIWGFRVMNLEPPDENGLTHPVNAPEENFIPDGQLRQVGPRMTKCPYSRDSGVTPAEFQRQ